MSSNWKRLPKYGHKHQAQRRHYERLVASGFCACNRCGGLILPDEPWDMGHDDWDDTVYTGPEHQHCNRVAGAKKLAALKRQENWSRAWF